MHDPFVKTRASYTFPEPNLGTLPVNLLLEKLLFCKSLVVHQHVQSVQFCTRYAIDQRFQRLVALDLPEILVLQIQVKKKSVQNQHFVT